jgi:hypothetical protein
MNDEHGIMNTEQGMMNKEPGIQNTEQGMMKNPISIFPNTPLSFAWTLCPPWQKKTYNQLSGAPNKSNPFVVTLPGFSNSFLKESW